MSMGGAEGDAGVVPGPIPACHMDEDCPAGHVCFEGRCVEGTRCDEAGQCPAGNICVAGLCFEGPAEGGSALVFDPARLGFSFNQVGQMMTRGASIGNAGDRPVTVTALRIEGDPTFTIMEAPAVPFTLAPSRQQPITIGYTANDGVLDMAEVVAVEANGEARMALASTSKVADPPEPCLNVVPQQLFFGSVQRGQSATQVFTLVSCSDLPVTVSRIDRGRSLFGVLPDTFQLDPQPALPIVLQAGQRQDVTVRFTPMQAGLQGGFWQIISDDEHEPEKRVDVSAIAAPPELEDVAFHIRMSWSTDLTDVDLHLVGPGGPFWSCEGDCFFGNGGPNWGDQNTFADDPFLDLDDVDGFGPENINLQAPIPGRYTIYAHYWSDHEGDPPDVEIEIIRMGQVVAHYGPQRLDNVDDLWEVATVDFPAYTITPVDRVINTPPGRGMICR